MTEQAVIGIDLGGTQVKLALVGQNGKVIARDATPFDPAASPEAVIAVMADRAVALTESEAIAWSDVRGIGVGAPGPMSPSQGRIFHCANLPMWIDVPLRALLSGRLDKPVVMDNDGNAAAFGEFWAGCGRGGGDIVVLTLGTGVGAGVILEGRIFHGDFENAAELGHTIVALDGLPCACGQRGCLEMYASASAVARRVCTALEHGEVSLFSAKLAGNGSPSARDVAETAQRGDELCARIWNEACRFLGVACVNIQHTFNPRRIALGGGMAQAGEFLITKVRDATRELTWKLHDDCPEIVLAELGYDAGVIGAAGLAWHS